MATFSAHQLSLVFGILGNFVSVLVFLSPMIYKRGSTEGFLSIPYSVALFSTMLMLYYAYLKGFDNAFLIITINSFGSITETIYLSLYLIYAPWKARIYTVKLFLFFNMGVYGLILLSTSSITSLAHGQRMEVVGWICALFSVCVFASPLSIMRNVIKTKSVEYMPFPLSFCLTLCAVMWFCYGFFVKDLFIATPNIVGFALSSAQMGLYFYYKNGQKEEKPVLKEEEPKEEIRNEVKLMDGTIITIVLNDMISSSMEDSTLTQRDHHPENMTTMEGVTGTADDGIDGDGDGDGNNIV